MRKIKINNWFIKENSLNISLSKFYVGIEQEKDNSYILYFIDAKGHNTPLAFNNLEEAVMFTEDVINKLNHRREIIKKYLELYRNDDDKVLLTDKDTKEIINDYFSKKFNTNLECKYEVSFKDGGPGVIFYLGEDKIKLEEQDLEEVFTSYANKLGYNYEGFKYIGGVHKKGNHFDDDTPYFEGIEISVNKEKNKVLKYNRK